MTDKIFNKSFLTKVLMNHNLRENKFLLFFFDYFEDAIMQDIPR